MPCGRGSTGAAPNRSSTSTTARPRPERCWRGSGRRVRRYRVLRSGGVTTDLDLIDDYLVGIYQDLGDDPPAAMERAAVRVDEALAYLRTFEHPPHRGTEPPEIRRGIRPGTSKRFIFSFENDEPASEDRGRAVDGRSG